MIPLDPIVSRISKPSQNPKSKQPQPPTGGWSRRGTGYHEAPQLTDSRRPLPSSYTKMKMSDKNQMTEMQPQLFGPSCYAGSGRLVVSLGGVGNLDLLDILGLAFQDLHALLLAVMKCHDDENKTKLEDVVGHDPVPAEFESRCLCTC